MINLLRIMSLGVRVMVTSVHHLVMIMSYVICIALPFTLNILFCDTTCTTDETGKHKYKFQWHCCLLRNLRKFIINSANPILFETLRMILNYFYIDQKSKQQSSKTFVTSLNICILGKREVGKMK